MTDALSEGIMAIIYLQKQVGIDEPVEVATTEWEHFTEEQKEHTLYLYRNMKKMDSMLGV